MDRRQYLAAVGVCTLGGVAGCVGGIGGGGDGRGTKLAADDGDDDDEFGWSVALSGDGSTALVGAHWDDDPNGRFGGSAYVFSREEGEWRQRAKLTADDGDGGENFGKDVALSADGTTALVGAHRDEDPNGSDAGSAYVFARADGNWTRQAKLAADDGDSSDNFGEEVALSGDGSTALVGAPGDEDPSGDSAGAAYVFTRLGQEWRQRSRLSPEDGDSDDQFGAAVALSTDGTTALVGATGDEDPNGDEAGSAYVFTRADGTWTQRSKLAAADGDSKDVFGARVVLSSDGATTLIGATGDEDPNGETEDGAGSGSAYVFSRSGDEWRQRSKLVASDGDPGDSFGFAVALSADGTTALPGAPLDRDPNGENGGSAYVFELESGTGPTKSLLRAGAR